MRHFTVSSLAVAEFQVSNDAAKNNCDAEGENTFSIVNHRFAWLDHAEAVAKYRSQIDVGNGPAIDDMFSINGRIALCGCNYGHN